MHNYSEKDENFLKSFGEVDLHDVVDEAFTASVPLVDVGEGLVADLNKLVKYKVESIVDRSGRLIITLKAADIGEIVKASMKYTIFFGGPHMAIVASLAADRIYSRYFKKRGSIFDLHLLIPWICSNKLSVLPNGMKEIGEYVSVYSLFYGYRISTFLKEKTLFGPLYMLNYGEPVRRFKNYHSFVDRVIRTDFPEARGSERWGFEPHRLKQSGGRRKATGGKITREDVTKFSDLLNEVRKRVHKIVSKFSSSLRKTLDRRLRRK